VGDLPFLWGAQYYRAPTPEPDCWEADLRRMRALGMNAVKLWVQWRWSHRRPDAFDFDDVARLMDLAAREGLAVTLNTIFDVAPRWLYDLHPDAKQVDASGHVVEPYAVGHRQIGGHPGPCYSHPAARALRERFLSAAVERFARHPAMAMWDVWNEPEQSFRARHPSMATITCYCGACQSAFVEWLRRKYGDVERLNAVWGRRYDAFEEAEAPRDPGTVTDFVDWREFHMDVMAEEGRWRIETVRRLDPRHTVYLHVVPNTMSVFSAVTCVDDFAMAEPCDVFAASTNVSPHATVQVVSAARGKTIYNVESHVNYGSAARHQRVLGLDDLRADLLPQVGMGVRGFLFWQFRAETLGLEAPAWGLVRTDGSDRRVTAAAEAFWRALEPHAEALMRCPPPAAEVGVWKSRRNEVYHFCQDGSLTPLAEDVDGWVRALYGLSVPFRFVSEAMLERGELEGLRLLVLPSPVYVTDAEAGTLARWVQAGGVLLSEAHLAAYSATRGRYARRLPGAGLAEALGITETESTSPYHLRLSEGETVTGALTDDERKAVAAGAPHAGPLVPVRLASGELLWGCDRIAALAGAEMKPLGTANGGDVCVGLAPAGGGWVLACGTNVGRAAARGDAGLVALLRIAMERASVEPAMGASADGPGAHVDLLCDAEGPRFVVAVNASAEPRAIRLARAPEGDWRGLFTGAAWSGPTAALTIGPREAELFARER